MKKMADIQWKQKDITHDRTFAVGSCGVRKILTPTDYRSEFVLLDNDEVIVTLPSSSMPVYYPLKRYPFRPRAKAVLMDLDGTTIRSESFWIWIIERTIQELLRDSRFHLTEKDMPYVSGFSVSEHLAYCIREYRIDAGLETARKKYFEITRHEMNEIMQGRGKADAYTIVDGLKEFLKSLKDNGIKIGLVTSGLYEKAMPEIISGFRQMKMGNPLLFYDAVITAGTTFQKGVAGTLGELSAKPHPWLYREICEVGLGFTQEDFEHVVVLEDSSAGVMSGFLAGFDVIGLKGGNIEASGLKDLLLMETDNFNGVLDLILGKGE